MPPELILEFLVLSIVNFDMFLGLIGCLLANIVQVVCHGSHPPAILKVV